jgi:hypothetical protein
VVLDSSPVGLTASDGTVLLSSVPQGSHDFQAENFTGDGGIQSAANPTPMTLSEMQALLPCSPFSMSGFASTCSVTGTYNTLLGFGPSCPSDLWTQECLALNTVPPQHGGSYNLLTEICACFGPPPPTTCDAQLSSEHLVSVPASGSVTYLLTLCTTCDNGTPNSSCQQSCLTNADCETTQTCSGASQGSLGVCAGLPTIDVALQMTQGGPIVCVKGSTFAPAASSAMLRYSNVPGEPLPPAVTQTADTLQILPDGTLAAFSDAHWAGLQQIAFNSNCGLGQNVTVSVMDQVSGQTASFLEPATYWCPDSTPAGTMIGDFCCTSADPTVFALPCP